MKHVWKKSTYDWKIGISEEKTGKVFTATVKEAKNKIDLYCKKHPQDDCFLFRVSEFGYCEEIASDELYDLLGY